MDSRQLRQFLTIVDEGTIRRAAAKLHISEPALSKTLRGLERSLGVRLLDRTPRGMVPTVFGIALADNARVVRAELEHAQKSIGELKKAATGHITVGAGPSYAARILPAAVTTLLRRRPGVRITVREALGTKLVDGVTSGEIDFAIVSRLESGFGPGLVYEPDVGRDQMMILGRSSLEITRRRSVQMRDLVDYKWAISRRPDPLRMQWEKLFTAAGLEPPNPSVEFGSITFLRSIVLEGDFLAYLPTMMMRDEIKSGRIRALNVQGTKRPRSVGFVYRKRATLHPLARQLMEDIRKKLAS